MPDFQSAYDRILEATGLRTQTEVADLLGIAQSSISDTLRRQSIPDQWLLTLFDTCALNPAWIRSGKGPRYVTGCDGQPSRTAHARMHPTPRTCTQGRAAGDRSRLGCGTAGGTGHGPTP